jgi:hypothetical protein
VDSPTRGSDYLQSTSESRPLDTRVSTVKLNAVKSFPAGRHRYNYPLAFCHDAFELVCSEGDGGSRRYLGDYGASMPVVQFRGRPDLMCCGS